MTQTSFLSWEDESAFGAPVLSLQNQPHFQACVYGHAQVCVLWVCIGDESCLCAHVCLCFYYITPLVPVSSHLFPLILFSHDFQVFLNDCPPRHFNLQVKKMLILKDSRKEVSEAETDLTNWGLYCGALPREVWQSLKRLQCGPFLQPAAGL